MVLKTEKIELEELEIDDIVYVDKQHWYCSVKDIFLTVNNRVAITFEHCLLSLGADFFKIYSLKKKYKLYD